MATKVSLVLAAACWAACAPTAPTAPTDRQGALIARYRAAACVAGSQNPEVTPRTREWDTPLSLPDGLRVVVRGAQGPCGEIVLFYPQTRSTVVAANGGDYICPSDVRVDLQKGLLYVKAQGVTWAGAGQTWLFEYDIHQRRLVNRQRVDDSGLPEECVQ